MRTVGRWLLGILAALVAVGVPAAYYRSNYTNFKRYREVTAGKLYRSGQFTASALRQVIRDCGIKTIVNLQEENDDPFMPEEWLGKPHIRQSELAEQLGLKHYALFGSEILDAEATQLGKRPACIDQFLKIMDDPANHPVLLHCKAGLHRTGRLTAIYRMEYEGWTMRRAMEELRANGYGTFNASTADDYIVQYVQQYKIGIRNIVTLPKPGQPLGANATTARHDGGSR
jgi:tyrosine-protein phosphatase SIW14